MKKIDLLLWSFLMFTSATGCVGHLVYPSGAYRGRVLDAETKEPLAGAVVLAIWYREVAFVPMAAHSPAVDYHDALEVLTDAQGEFTVAAKTHLTVIGKIREPEFVIYYPGYGFYPYYQVHPQGKEVDGSYETRFFHVELPRLKTRQEQLEVLTGLPYDPQVPDAKMPHSIRLMNQEQIRLGLRPTHVPRQERRP